MHTPPRLSAVVWMRNITTSNSVTDDLQEALQKTRLPYSDGLYDSQTDLTIRKNKDRESTSSRSVKGISLRGFSGSGWVYANTNRTDKNAIHDLLRRLNKMRLRPGSAKLTEPSPIKLNRETPVKIQTQDIPTEDKLQKVRSIFNLARSMDSHIVDVRVAYSELNMERVLVTATGTEARQVIPHTRISLAVIVKEGEVTDYDYQTFGGTVGYEVADDLTEEVVGSTVRSAVEQLRAIPPPPGFHRNSRPRNSWHGVSRILWPWLRGRPSD